MHTPCTVKFHCLQTGKKFANINLKWREHTGACVWGCGWVGVAEGGILFATHCMRLD